MREGIPLPDLIRRELQGALVRDRVPFSGFPDLERSAPRHGGAPMSRKD